MLSVSPNYTLLFFNSANINKNTAPILVFTRNLFLDVKVHHPTPPSLGSPWLALVFPRRFSILFLIRVRNSIF